MEPKPKERIVFDEDLYYGDEGEKMAIDDLMERDGLTEGEVREDFTDYEIFNHQMEMKDFDYEEEMRALAAFFNGEKSDMSDFVNPYGGNHILVSGSVGRWNGTSTGIAVYKDFDAATDCSPSRFGQGNVFADCEIQKVWDENGTPARCGRWRLFPFGGSERSRPLALRSPGEQESRPQYDSETE